MNLSAFKEITSSRIEISLFLLKRAPVVRFHDVRNRTKQSYRSIEFNLLRTCRILTDSHWVTVRKATTCTHEYR